MSQAIGPEQIARIRREYPESAWEIPYIEEAGFTWKLVIGGSFPDLNHRMQIRDKKLTASPREVSRIEHGYRRGDRIPAPVLSRDLWVLDGNTRLAAATKAKLSELNYFRLDVPMEGASEASEAGFVTLATALNNLHGKRVTDKNLERLILMARREGDGKTPRQVAAELHCSASMVNNVIALDRGSRRALELGFKPDGFSTSHLRRFGGGLEKQTNEVLHPFMELILTAGLTVAETGDIARRLEALHTDEDKLELLTAEKLANASRTGGFSNRPSPAGAVRRGLGHVLKVRDNPALAVERDATAGKHNLEVLLDSQETIGDLIAEQRRVLREQEHEEEGSPVTPRFTPPSFSFRK
jgi:hypothetical protein